MEKRDYFPKWEEEKPSKRRYRIWCAKLTDQQGAMVKKIHGFTVDADAPGRRYKEMLRAHDQALLLVRWENEGTVFEVYDCQNQDLIGVYVRRAKQVAFEVLKGGK